MALDIKAAFESMAQGIAGQAGCQWSWCAAVAVIMQLLDGQMYPGSVQWPKFNSN